MKYRGVIIDPGQSQSRVAKVKRAIDAVLAENTLRALAAYSDDASNPPEARVLAATKAEELIITAKEGRQKMPGDLERMRAVIAGLSAPGWRSETHYCALFDSHERAVPREG
jgi:hypothetical protein